jgi:hypothetical protein
MKHKSDVFYHNFYIRASFFRMIILYEVNIKNEHTEQNSRAQEMLRQKKFN